jgi:hypothetical protein
MDTQNISNAWKGVMCFGTGYSQNADSDWSLGVVYEWNGMFRQRPIHLIKNC